MQDTSSIRQEIVLGKEKKGRVWPSSVIRLNPSIRLLKNTLIWKAWIARGINDVSQVLASEGWIPFSNLNQKYGLPNGEFLRYNQLKRVITQLNIQAGPDSPPPNETFKKSAHLASALYKGSLRKTMGD